MEFKIKTKTLKEALKLVQKGASNNKVNPILACAEIKAEGDRIGIRTTQLENSIAIVLDKAEIREEGEVLINIYHLSEFISKINIEEIEITKEDNKLCIKYGKSKGKLNLNEGILPEIKNDNFKIVTVLPGLKLSAGIESVAYVAASQHSRPVFTGVNVIFSSETVEFVASDTFKLAYNKTECSCNEETNLIIPAKSAVEVSKIFADQKEVTVKTDGNHAVFQTENITYSCRLINGVFPQFQQILKKPENVKAEIEITEELIGIIERVRLLQDDKNMSVCKIKLDPQNKEINISSSSEIIGEINEIYSSKKEDTIKEELEIAFNSKYLLQVGEKYISGRLVLGRNIEPVYFEEKEGSCSAVLTPIRIPETQAKSA